MAIFFLAFCSCHDSESFSWHPNHNSLFTVRQRGRGSGSHGWSCRGPRLGRGSCHAYCRQVPSGVPKSSCHRADLSERLRQVDCPCGPPWLVRPILHHQHHRQRQRHREERSWTRRRLLHHRDCRGSGIINKQIPPESFVQHPCFSSLAHAFAMPILNPILISWPQPPLLLPIPFQQSSRTGVRRWWV